MQQLCTEHLLFPQYLIVIKISCGVDLMPRYSYYYDLLGDSLLSPTSSTGIGMSFEIEENQ